MIRIALRFDDPSPTSDHALERELLAICAKLAIPITAAVVPYGRNNEPIQPDNVPHLVAAHAAGLLEVAQHGLRHKQMTTNSRSVPSEFQGVPALEQADQIDAGRRILESTFPGRITGFIPPWNTYDATTLDLLAERGYAYISSSNSSCIPHKPGIRLFSHTCQVSQLEDAYRQASRYRNPAIIIAIMHHYDFKDGIAGNPATLQGPADLERSLSRLRQAADVEFTTLAHLASAIGVDNAWNAQLRQLRLGEMHWRLRNLFPSQQLLLHPLWRYLLERKWYAHT